MRKWCSGLRPTGSNGDRAGKLLKCHLDLVGALQTIDGKGRFILIDCLTIWLSNLMIVKLDVARETEMLCEALKKIKAQVVLVSNEVGLGIVPANAVARAFRDDAGVSQSAGCRSG